MNQSAAGAVTLQKSTGTVDPGTFEKNCFWILILKHESKKKTAQKLIQKLQNFTGPMSGCVCFREWETESRLYKHSTQLYKSCSTKAESVSSYFFF